MDEILQACQAILSLLHSLLVYAGRVPIVPIESNHPISAKRALGSLDVNMITTTACGLL